LDFGLWRISIFLKLFKNRRISGWLPRGYARPPEEKRLQFIAAFPASNRNPAAAGLREAFNGS